MDIAGIQYFMEALPDATLLVSRRGDIIGANKTAVEKLKYTPSQLSAMMVEDLVPERYREKHATLRHSFAMSTQLRPMGSENGKYFPAKLAGGDEIITEISIGRLEARDSDGDLLLVILIDRTDKVRLEEELKKRANIDALTELYSRQYFFSLLGKEMERASRYRHNLALIYLADSRMKCNFE